MSKRINISDIERVDDLPLEQWKSILEFPSSSHCARYFNVCLNSIRNRVDKLIPIKNHLIYSL